MPRSPCTASAGCRNTAAVPVLHSVATILRAMWPLLPMPVTITFPGCARINSTARISSPSSLEAAQRIESAEVEVEDVEAQVLADARGFAQDGGVGAEQLGGNGMLIGVEAEVALQRLIGLVGLERRADAVRAGELRHDEPAPAKIANETAEYRVGHAGHRRQHRGGRELHRSDRKLCGEGLHGRADSILALRAELKPGAPNGSGSNQSRDRQGALAAILTLPDKLRKDAPASGRWQAEACPTNASQ